MTSQDLNGCFGPSYPYPGRALCSSLVVLLALGATAAGAATITVNGTTCTLANAITAANTDAPVPANGTGCPAGSGADTIDLQTNVDITTTPGLPDITSTITIQGNGLVIQRPTSPVTTGRIFNIPSGNLTLNSVTLRGGNIAGPGGAINVTGAGTLAVIGSTITTNRATGATGIGGGISHNGNGAVTVTNSTITNNAAGSNGGGIRNLGGGAFTISGSTIAVNTAGGAAGAGGGIRNNGSILTVTNSTIANNTANGPGGAISNVNNNGTASITYSTLSGNTASNGGGINNDTSAAITLVGNIISGNTSTSGGQEFSNNNATVTSNYNLFGRNSLTYAQAISGFTPGATDILATSTLSNGSANPFATALAGILNSTLASNGGPTQTLALVAASPAINRIPINNVNPPCTPGGTTKDQRGRDRGNGINNGGVSCDIGAFEYGYVGTNSTSSISVISQSKATNPTPDPNYPIGLNPAGVYTLTLTLQLNAGSTPQHNVFFQVMTLSNNNFLLNADGQPGQAGAQLSVPDASLPGGNSLWDPPPPSDLLIQAFRIGLSNLNKFQFFIDVYSEPQGVNNQRLIGVNGPDKTKATYLGRLEFEISAEDLKP